MEAANLTKSLNNTLTTSACSDGDPKKAIHILAVVTNFIIFIVGITGNGIVIWLAGFKMKKNICLIWYLNLAIADFVFCALRILNVVREAMCSHWPFGSLLCKVNSFMKYFNLFASVLLLVVISVDRCIMVASPIWCRIHRNIKRSAIVCGGVWVLATVLSLPYALYADTCRKGALITCDYSCGHKKNTSSFALRLSRFIISFVIPITIIIVSNYILTIQLKQKKQKIARNAMGLIKLVIIAFFVCWFPHHVLVFLKKHHECNVTWIAGFKIANFLAFFSSCINPMFYFFTGYLRRNPQHQSLLSVLSRVFVEDASSVSEPESLQMTGQTTA